MPPRKRQRVSQATSPTPTAQAKSPTPAAASSPQKGEDEAATPQDSILNDPWTDEEESGLFKGLINFKPTGIHKHFRMLQLHQHLVSQNHIHPKAQHTTITGIWTKLHTLYDLPSLDEREDARQLSPISGEAQDSDNDEEDVYSLAENKIHNEIFALPEEDYGDMMWKRRLPSSKEQRGREKSESPAELPEINLAKEAPIHFEPKTTVSAEPPSSPARRGRGRRKGSIGKEKDKEAERPSGRRKSARQAAEESANEESEEADEEDEEEEESSGEEDEESEEATPAPKTGRGSGRARGRPAKGAATGRGRGRKR